MTNKKKMNNNLIVCNYPYFVNADDRIIECGAQIIYDFICCELIFTNEYGSVFLSEEDNLENFTSKLEFNEEQAEMLYYLYNLFYNNSLKEIVVILTTKTTRQNINVLLSMGFEYYSNIEKLVDYIITHENEWIIL